MRFRFTATTSSGDLRSAVVEAPDEASARRQLLARGMQVETLQAEASQAPVFIRSREQPASPASTASPLVSAQAAERIRLRDLDRGKLARVGAAVLLLCLVAAWGVAWWRAPRTYRFRFTGHVRLQAGRARAADHWSKQKPRLIFPEMGRLVAFDGRVWDKNAEGNWVAAERGLLNLSVDAEGNYVLIASAALPRVPTIALISLYEPGFHRRFQKVKLRQSGSQLGATVPEIYLARRRHRSAAPGAKAAGART